MSDAPEHGRAKLNVTLEELREAQRRTIEKAAKKTIASIKRVIEAREHLVPGANAAHEQLYGEWYRSVERDLVAAAFEPFGPYRNANKSPETQPQTDAYYHLALSADRTTTAVWFVFAAKEPRYTLVLESVATDGRVIVTASGVVELGIPPHPSRDIEHLSADTPPAQLLAGHRAHLARTSAPLREFTGVQEILTDRLRRANETSAFRRGLGIGILEPVLRAQSHGHFEVRGKPVLEAILAHPEWWTDDTPAAGGTAPPETAPPETAQ